MPYIDVFQLMEYANNMKDKTIDANDIARFPWADVHEVKQGKWLWVDGVRCSNCNHKLQTTGLPSYCPNCGAKMD